MLKLFRNEGFIKKIIWLVVILIVLSFGVFGTAYLMSDVDTTQTHAGEIFGKKIDQDEFRSAVHEANMLALLQYGDQYQQVRRQLDLEAQAWDRLILLEEADKRGLTATNEDVVAEVQKYPFFQKDGRFDKETYNNIINNVFRVTPREFEETIRRSLIISKLFEEETQGIEAEEGKALEVFTQQNEKVQVSYLQVSANQYKNDVEITDEELKTYYDENKVRFILTESIELKYIAFPFESADDESKKNEIREVAEKAADSLYENNDIEATAKEFNTTAKSSGFISHEVQEKELGWPLNILSDVLNLNDKEMIGPFETENAVVIAQMQSRENAFIPELKQIRSKVEEALRQEKAFDLAEEKAFEIYSEIQDKYNQTKEKKDLKLSDLAENIDADIKQTPVFNRGQYLPNIGIEYEFQTAAFELNESKPLSDLIETEQGYFILFFDQYVPISEEAFNQDKLRIENQLTFQERQKKFAEFVSQLKASANLTIVEEE